MKSTFHIAVLVLLAGMATVVPVTKHYCGGMLVRQSIMDEKEHSCCEHENMPKECCYNEINFFTEEHSLNINVSSIEIGELSDFWVENLLADLTLNSDLFDLINVYRTTSEIPLKIEVGLYRYVQSFLI